MSYRRRYSPSYNGHSSVSSSSTGLMRGPSSIYTSTSTALGGSSYLRDGVGNPGRSASSISPRRYQKTPSPRLTSSSMPSRVTLSSTLPASYQSRSRSARISSILNDTDTFSRTRSRSPIFSSTGLTSTTKSSSWRPRTTTDYSNSKSLELPFTSSSYRNRHRSADLDATYSIDQDPIVSAISDRLMRETSGSHQRFSMPNEYKSTRDLFGNSFSTFDCDAMSDSCIGYNRKPFYLKNFGNTDYFSKEEKKFLSSLKQMVNNANYSSNEKSVSSSVRDRLWSNQRLPTRRFDNFIGRGHSSGISDRYSFTPNFSSGLGSSVLGSSYGLGSSGGGLGSLVRSNSFHELRDLEFAASLGANPVTAPSIRDRHKTLAYGVSAADLGMVLHPAASTSALAAINYLKSNPLPEFNLGSYSNSGYEQAANVGIRGPAAVAPLSGFKSEMSIALIHPSESAASRNSNHDLDVISDRSENIERGHRNHSGEIDYRKMWESTQIENIKLRDDLNKVRDDLKTTRKELDTVTSNQQAGLNESEKKEKKVMEKKLSEMEEELKLLALSENLTDQQLAHLKNDNQRLRDENGALIRVISKLSK